MSNQQFSKDFPEINLITNFTQNEENKEIHLDTVIEATLEDTNNQLDREELES